MSTLLNRFLRGALFLWRLAPGWVGEGFGEVSWSWPFLREPTRYSPGVEIGTPRKTISGRSRQDSNLRLSPLQATTVVLR